MAYGILARNPEFIKKFIEFGDEIMKKGKLFNFEGKDRFKSI